VAYALPLLGGARARALDFVFSLGEDTLGAPVLRLLPAEPDAEKRTLRVLVTQDTPGAVAGSLVHYELGDLWVCELQPAASSGGGEADGGGGGGSLSADGMETLAGALDAAVKPMRAALTASATLGCVTAVTPVFIRPNSAVSRALLCGAGGIGSEAAALREAVEGKEFLSELTPKQIKTALLADGADELFAPGPWCATTPNTRPLSPEILFAAALPNQAWGAVPCGCVAVLRYGCVAAAAVWLCGCRYVAVLWLYCVAAVAVLCCGCAVAVLSLCLLWLLWLLWLCGASACRDISLDPKKQRSALLDRRESPTVLAACPELRLVLLTAAALEARCEMLRKELGGAAELPPPLGAQTAVRERASLPACLV
jgi:hypothetical protein